MIKKVPKNLLDFSLPEMEKLALEHGKKRYAGRQLYKWLFQVGLDDFDGMTDLARAFRQALSSEYVIGRLVPVRRAISDDGTVKTVWQTRDDLMIESVLIPEEKRLTLCMSSQAGCPVGCDFCATGRNGFRRNLSPGEIYDQYLLTACGLSNKKITNIVFMGMGEPFLNYDSLMKATAALTSQLGAGLAARKITISTIGLIHGIYRLAEENPRYKLAISLHSAIEEKRRQLIPIARKNPLADLKRAAEYYALKTDTRMTFEYLLLGGVNDSSEDARALAEFVRGIPCKINLITYNEVWGSRFHRSDEETTSAFRDYLYPRTSTVTIRKSRGGDIAAACGQLAGAIRPGN
jgi:23S rRNA (adenine2503-C2)-methyltransferase